MRVLQLRGDLNLAAEPVDVHPGELGVQHLHDHLTVEGALAGEKHAAHPAAAELALNGERIAEGLSRAARAAHPPCHRCHETRAPEPRVFLDVSLLGRSASGSILMLRLRPLTVPLLDDAARPKPFPVGRANPDASLHHTRPLVPWCRPPVYENGSETVTKPSATNRWDGPMCPTSVAARRYACAAST